jgi:hypothetical protein
VALPLPCLIPSEYKYTDTYQPELFFLHLPRKMEPIEGYETSAFKPQTPGKYPKENIPHKYTNLPCKILQSFKKNSIINHLYTKKFIYRIKGVCM